MNMIELYIDLKNYHPERQVIVLIMQNVRPLNNGLNYRKANSNWMLGQSYDKLYFTWCVQLKDGHPFMLDILIWVTEENKRLKWFPTVGFTFFTAMFYHNNFWAADFRIQSQWIHKWGKSKMVYQIRPGK